jgi:hypothetical protein
VKHRRANTRGQQPLAYGIIDPDYAKAFSIIRIVAWQYGYAAAMHGSFTRDLDVLLVPWTDRAIEALWIVKQCADRTELVLKTDEPTSKPHGRQTWTLLYPGFKDPRWIDLSVMPRLLKPPVTPP